MDTFIGMGLAFIYGLVIGSFLNVVILRSRIGESFVKGRSHCPSCRHYLSWYELIPVFSFLRQYGKCLSCGGRISWQYPAVELVTGVSFAFLFGILMPDIYGLMRAGITVSAVIVILVSDMRFKIIPNGAVLALIFASAVGMVVEFSGWAPLFHDIAAAVIIAFFFFALWFFSRGTWMGLGDAKLILATSLLVGFPVSVAAFFFSFWAGGIFGIILLILKRGGLKSQIPFGPFILLGTALASVLADEFINFIRGF